jgi:hypothetical protein
MGYSYGRSENGRWLLSCDNCGAVGEVRKRTCPYKVTTTEGHALPYCPAPALCGPCFAKYGGTRGVHGAECAKGAAASQARYDEERARLATGDSRVRGAWGEWQEYVPAGRVGLLFRNQDGRERHYTVTAEEYDTHGPWLSEYPDAQPWCGPDGTMFEISSGHASA